MIFCKPTEEIRAMKTIILYATKHGAAGVIAQQIADRIKGAAIHNLKQGGVSLAGYDCVIIGSSIYAGRARKEARAFVTQNADVLKQKKLGLFLSTMETSNDNTYFESNYPKEIVQAAKAMSCPGGIFDPKKAGGMERFIIKLIKKKVVYMDNIDYNKIDQFAKTMNG